MNVADIMQPRPETVGPKTSLDEIARVMRDQKIGSVPVIENESIIGIVTDRDLATRCVAEGYWPDERCAADIMSAPVTCCRSDATVETAAALFERHQVRRLPIVDEDTALVGMLSISDLVRCGEATLALRALKATVTHIEESDDD